MVTPTEELLKKKQRLKELNAKEKAFQVSELEDKKRRLRALDAKERGEDVIPEQDRRRLEQLNRQEIQHGKSILKDIGASAIQPYKQAGQAFVDTARSGQERLRQPGFGNKALGVLESTIAPGFNALNQLTQGVVKPAAYGISQGLDKIETFDSGTTDGFLGTTPGQFTQEALTGEPQDPPGIAPDSTFRSALGMVTGTPEEFSEAAGIVSEFVTPGGLIKQANKLRAILPGTKVAPKGIPAREVMDVSPTSTNAAIKEAKTIIDPKTLQPLKIDPAVQANLVKQIDPPGTIAPSLKPSVVEDIGKESIDLLKSTPTKGRITEQIAQAIGKGEIEADIIPIVQAKFGLNSAEMADLFRLTASSAGQTLNRLSQVRKQLNAAFKDEKTQKLIAQFFGESKSDTILDKIVYGFQKLGNLRRGLLVTRFATAVRNGWAQLGRAGVGVFDEVLQGAIRGAVTPGAGTTEAVNGVKSGLDNFMAFFHKLSPKQRARFSEIIDNDMNVVQKGRLLFQPVHEVTLSNKLVTVLNTLNRAQEVFFRKAAFEGKLRSLLRRAGKDYDTISVDAIPPSFIEQSVNYSLEMTFAAAPKSKFARQFINAFRDIPVFDTINPFPRFAFGNALPFILEHSPLGYLKAMRPETLRKLAANDPDDFAKAASRASLGTYMLAKAIELRQSASAGERYFEIESNDNTIMDLRPFGPFTTYLFIAEAIMNPDSIKFSDWAEVVAGLNRVSGNGLSLIDSIRTDSATNTKDDLADIIGQYVASFLTPMKNVTDIIQQFDREEATQRFQRERRIIDPIIARLPGISKMLPEKQSPITAARQKVEAPIFTMITGLGVKFKPIVQREMDRLGIEYRNVLNKTGLPIADNILNGFQGPIVEQLALELFTLPAYKNAQPDVKRILFSKMITAGRDKARRKLVIEEPQLARAVALQSQSADKRSIIERISGIKPDDFAATGQIPISPAKPPAVIF
tara:strand:+ start:1915 stop:4821 length:2907 start_codon:yes stop_codon:yes gene_type:complete